MIIRDDMPLERFWQKRFGFGPDTVNVVAFTNSYVVILKDPIGIHFVKKDRYDLIVLGYNVKKSTLRRFLDKFDGKEKDDHWTIRRPWDIGLKSGDRINGRVYSTNMRTLKTTYPETLIPVED